MELEESWIFGMLWPKRLRILENRIEASNVELLRETVETVSYDEVEDVVVGGRGTSASLLIRTSEFRPILIRGIDEDAAHQAKTLIETLVHSTTRNNQGPHESSHNTKVLLRNLTELREAGVLTPEEFEVKRKAIEKDL